MAAFSGPSSRLVEAHELLGRTDHEVAEKLAAGLVQRPKPFRVLIEHRRTPERRMQSGEIGYRIGCLLRRAAVHLPARAPTASDPAAAGERVHVIADRGIPARRDIHCYQRRKVKIEANLLVISLPHSMTRLGRTGRELDHDGRRNGRCGFGKLQLQPVARADLPGADAFMAHAADRDLMAASSAVQP